MKLTDLRFVPIAVVCGVALGCASTAPTTTRYLLRGDVPEGTARLAAPERISLGAVEVAPYLGERGLVVETEPNQIRPARYHVWAEPLADGLRGFLVAEISNALGYPVGSDTAHQIHWDRTVDVRIDRLHGTLSGDAVLVARWTITPGSGAGDAVAFQLAASQPLLRRGYGGLVEAEIALLRRLAAAIAESLSAR
jgi:uncharacterized lipoprotein YmbA